MPSQFDCLSEAVTKPNHFRADITDPGRACTLGLVPCKPLSYSAVDIRSGQVDLINLQSPFEGFCNLYESLFAFTFSLLSFGRDGSSLQS